MSVELLGIEIDNYSFEGAVEQALTLINSDRVSQVVTINPEMFSEAESNMEFKTIIDDAEMVIPDGVGVKIALKIKGHNVERIPGIDFAKKLLLKSSENNLPVAIIGSKEEVINKAVENLKNEINNLNIVYYHNGYFKDNNEIYEKLKESMPKLVLVALGSPKQEYFIYNAKKVLSPCLMVGIGGSLDVWSGTVKRAPKVFQKLGLEWLYRTISQPERFKRIFPALPLFLIKVLNIKDKYMLTSEELNSLQEKANNVRKNIVKIVHNSKSGHPGGSLSGADILTVLYEKCLNIPSDWDKNSAFEKRDRFILSKGHASPLLYSVLAQHGMFEEELLLGFRKFGSKLQGHPAKGYVPGVETSTGSLGQGLSIGCGIALGLKLNNNPANVIVYTGDGELQEGSCWEAIMQAAHRKLDNLIVIVDRNRLQIDGNTENVMSLENLPDKIRAFNWDVFVIDGHDYNQIYDTFRVARESDKPCAIIANTIKGKGVSFMENNPSWHGKAPNDEEYLQAMKELGE